MENEIKYISDYMTRKKWIEYELLFQDILSKYFGIKEQAQTEQAMAYFKAAFGEGGTGVNSWEFVDNGDGTFRIVDKLEITIRAEYIPLVVILANVLGYTQQG